jgi:glutaredoxin
MGEALGGGVRDFRFLVIVIAALVLGCPHKKSGGTGGSAEPSAPFVIKDTSDGLLLTWIDEHGDFHVEQKPQEVPIVGRDAVRVVDPARDDGTHADKIFVADLRVAGPDGAYPIKTMTRADFDAIAVARREKTGPTLASAAPPDKEPPTDPVQPRSPLAQNDPPGSTRPLVIIYGADWCGPCHEAAAYLRGKGVAFVEKNVETDRDAAREMQQKLTKNGLRGGSIPVLDVKGKIMIGFNPHSVDEALGRAI